MPWISQHYTFDQTGSFRLNIDTDLPKFKTKSENSDDIIYSSARMRFTIYGEILDFPTVNRG